MALGSEVLLQEGRGEEERDTDLLQLPGNRTEKGFSVAFAELGQKEQRLEVGPQVEKIPWGDLARHYRGGGAALFGGVEHSSQLADTHPVKFVGKIRKGRVGLPLESRRHDMEHAGLTGSACGKTRVVAVACDQEEGVRGRHSGSHEPIPLEARGVA